MVVSYYTVITVACRLHYLLECWETNSFNMICLLFSNVWINGMYNIVNIMLYVLNVVVHSKFDTLMYVCIYLSGHVLKYVCVIVMTTYRLGTSVI